MQKSDYKRLGDYIRPVDIRNRDLQCSNLLGLSIAKRFIPSIANTIGTDLSTYKIVCKDQFAYVPVTSRNGDKITIALYRGVDECIVSQAYTVFEIIDTEILLPEYLMMWFQRSEFDRYARFKSIGSAREVFDWGEMCDVFLPIPNKDVQQRVVSEFKTIENRIAVNESLVTRLEESALTIFRKMFIDGIDPDNLPAGWHKGTLGELATVSSGKSLTDKQDVPTGGYVYPVAGASGIIGYAKDYNQKEPFLTTGRVGTIGVVNKYKEKSWTADNVLVVKSPYYEFSYQILKALRYEDIMKGGVQSLITQTDLKDAPIVVPSKDDLDAFELKAKSIDSAIDLMKKENKLLSNANLLLLERMSYS